MSLSHGEGGDPPLGEIRAQAQSEPTRRRKPYQKPAFQFERVFETQALSCGKLPGQSTACKVRHKTS